jgi:hypothetical protein
MEDTLKAFQKRLNKPGVMAQTQMPTLYRSKGRKILSLKLAWATNWNPDSKTKGYESKLRLISIPYFEFYVSLEDVLNIQFNLKNLIPHCAWVKSEVVYTIQQNSEEVVLVKGEDLNLSGSLIF